MLNKIKSIFKDGELEKEVEILRESLMEREFLYNELSRTNIFTLQKNKDLEKDILNLKAEFPKLEAAYSEEYQKRLKSKLKIEEEKFEKKILELQNEYSTYFLKETEKFKLKIESIEKEKIELQKALILEKSAKENLSKEILDLKDLLRERKETVQNLEDKKEVYMFDSNKYGSWSNTEVYLLNKANLIPIISTFCLDDFKEILLEGKKREVFSEAEKIQIANVITWLKLNTPLAKLNVKKVEAIYIKLMESLLKEKSENKLENNKNEKIEETKIENVIQKKSEEVKSNWANKEKFLQNKDDLVGLLKTFEAKDFMEMYLEGKKRGVLKSLKDKDFTNIMTRLKLKLPLTDMSLEKIENFYEELMKDIHPEKISKNQKVVESIEEDHLKEDFEIESYTACDWYKLYEIAKEFKVKEWLQKSIFIIARLKDSNSEVSDSQYAVIKRNYSDLYEIFEKFKSDKKNSKITKITLKNSEIENVVKSLSSEDWYKIFELIDVKSKDEEILKKHLFSLHKYKQKNSTLTKSQMIVIKNNYNLIKDIISFVNKKEIEEKSDETTIKNHILEIDNEKKYEIKGKAEEKKDVIELDQNIADILF